MTRRKVATVLTAFDDDGSIMDIIEIPAGQQLMTPRIWKKILLRYPFLAARVTRHNVFETGGAK